jgi:hypothetical protein
MTGGLSRTGRDAAIIRAPVALGLIRSNRGHFSLLTWRNVTLNPDRQNIVEAAFDAVASCQVQ